MPDVVTIKEVEKHTFSVHLPGLSWRYLSLLLLLSEEIQGGKEAEETKRCIDERYVVKRFSMKQFHGAVVRSIQSEVEEEDGEEVVGSSRSAGDAEVKTEKHVNNCHHQQTNESGSSLEFTLT